MIIVVAYPQQHQTEKMSPFLYLLSSFLKFRLIQKGNPIIIKTSPTVCMSLPFFSKTVIAMGFLLYRNVDKRASTITTIEISSKLS